MKPEAPASPKKREESKKSATSPIYAEKHYYEKAAALFNGLTTLEDKVAQLCFYLTEASYDALVQSELARLIQKWQIGGLIFTSGHYKRQAYLIEHYQRLSRISLLIGNDLLYNLTFYFQDELPKEELSEQHCSDLGKAVMGQNKPLGVQFLFDHSCSALTFAQDEKQRKALRRGVRQAQGIVARDIPPSLSVNRMSPGWQT